MRLRVAVLPKEKPLPLIKREFPIPWLVEPRNLERLENKPRWALIFRKSEAEAERLTREKRIVKLGGLWREQPEITEEDIAEVRREMWGGFGEREL
jgi:hypothetical protein